MRIMDGYGLTLTAGEDAAAAYNRGIDRVLRMRSGAVDSVGDGDHPRPHLRARATRRWRCSATSSAPRSTSTPGSATPACTPAAARSASAATCTRSSEHVRGDSAPLVSHLERYPRDALLLSTAVPTIAFAGVTSVPEEAWEIVERAAPAYGNDWWYAGLLAFMRQEQGRFDEAMDLACTSLAARARRRATPRTRGRTRTTRPATTSAACPGWTSGSTATAPRPTA